MASKRSGRNFERNSEVKIEKRNNFFRQQQMISPPGLDFEDGSLVYCRDRYGVLSSPPGYDKYSNTNESCSLRDTVYDACCVGPTQHSPCNLFQICKNFVARNLHLLESLHNFPETIGQELFVEALQVQTFKKNSDYLKIFCEAYKHLVLKHLCLKEATTLIDTYLEYFQCFNSLTKLDLSHCRLGNEHKYLKFIGKMKSLECLYLKDNCLTDSGLIMWSLPHRMLNTGPELLKTLDLSCNPSLTDSCLKSLLKFSHLKSLNLSGTAVTLTPGISKMKKQMNFALVSCIEEFSKEVSTITSGWAAPLISALSLKLNEKKIKEKFEWPSKTGTFYQPLGTSPVTDVSKEICTNIYPVVLLQSVEHVLPGTLRTLEESGEGRGKKRLVTSDQHRKRQKLCNEHVQYEDEMSDAKIIDSYLKYL